ncbi:hypothetical protein FKM82_022880 [Ascaphus truei]
MRQNASINTELCSPRVIYKGVLLCSFLPLKENWLFKSVKDSVYPIVLKEKLSYSSPVNGLVFATSYPLVQRGASSRSAVEPARSAAERN